MITSVGRLDPALAAAWLPLLQPLIDKRRKADEEARSRVPAE
jgi:hypothetical protein